MIDGKLIILLVLRPPSRSMLSVLGTVLRDGSARDQVSRFLRLGLVR